MAEYNVKLLLLSHRWSKWLWISRSFILIYSLSLAVLLSTDKTLWIAMQAIYTIFIMCLFVVLMKYHSTYAAVCFLIHSAFESGHYEITVKLYTYYVYLFYMAQTQRQWQTERFWNGIRVEKSHNLLLIARYTYAIVNIIKRKERREIQRTKNMEEWIPRNVSSIQLNCIPKLINSIIVIDLKNNLKWNYRWGYKVCTTKYFRWFLFQ